MKSYYRIMLGSKSKHAEECYKENFIGAGYNINEDLTSNLPDNWKSFNAKYIPIYLKIHPDKAKVAAGLSCGQLWTICKGIKIGDIIICPDGSGSYFTGEVTLCVAHYMSSSHTGRSVKLQTPPPPHTHTHTHTHTYLDRVFNK